MSLLGDLKVKLGIDTSQFTAGLSAAAAAASSFSENLADDFKNAGYSSNNATKQLNIFAQSAGKGFKDVGRIAQGILVSQGFYKIISMAKSATNALATFSTQSEDARASFGLLLKDGNQASSLMTKLQDYAARTPFTFQQSADSARKLLAYGFKSQNLEAVMNPLADAAAASGDNDALERIGKALGEIQAKGSLAARQLLQITSAGIPAYSILQEKLGLTSKQLENIGKMHIPADVAIKAILSGMQERYGGASKIMSNTVQGMLNTLKDNAKIIGSDAFSPLYDSFKNVLTKLRDSSDKLRDVLRSGGIGGLIKSLVPSEIFEKIQLFSANIKLLRENLGLLAKAMIPVIQVLAEAFLNIMNMILPVLNVFLRIVAVVIQYINSCSQNVKILVGAFIGLMVASWATRLLLNFGAAVKGLFIIKAVVQLVIWLADAIKILSLAIETNPWIALLGLGAGALLYFGLTSKKVSGWITGVGNKITSAFGADPTKQFTPKIKQSTAVAGDFNKSLEISKDNLDNLGDSADKAGKKAKDSLMSFDEVFNVQNEDEATKDNGIDAGDLSDLGDDVPTIPAVTMPDPVMPDVTSTVQKWVDQFKDTIITKLKNALAGAGIGAAIGAVIGGLLGGPGGAALGAKIGLAAGAIAGLFWDKLSDQMKNTAKAAGIGAAIGGVIGGIFGGPEGAVLGMAIGACASSVVGYFWEDLKKFFTASTMQGAAIGTTVGGMIGFALGGPLGAAVGAGLGATIGTIVGHFWSDIVKYFQSSTGQGTVAGTAIGAAVGGMIGGPVGAVVGSIVGGILGSQWQNISNWWTQTKAGLDTWWSDTQSGFDIWWGNTESGFDGWSKDTDGKINTWWTNTTTTLGNWCTTTWQGFSGWWMNTGLGFSTWVTNTGKGISGWWTDTTTGFGTWVTNTEQSLSGWWTNTEKSFGDWKTVNWTTINGWITDTATGFGTWWTNTEKGFGDWKSTTATHISTWYANTKGNISDWVSKTGSGLSGWWTDTKSGFSTWETNTRQSVQGWYDGTTKAFSNWLSSSGSGFATWWKNTSKGFSDWATGIYDDVTGWFDKLGKQLSDFFSQLEFWKKSANSGSFTISTQVTGAGGGGAHANGGVFNKHHIAEFAEGNKAEAIIPLENKTAMQPFVDAVAGGLSTSMGSIIAEINRSSSSTSTPGTGGADSRPILYVGTLVASDQSLRELNRKMNVIQLQEDQRRGRA